MYARESSKDLVDERCFVLTHQLSEHRADINSENFPRYLIIMTMLKSRLDLTLNLGNYRALYAAGLET